MICLAEFVRDTWSFFVLLRLERSPPSLLWIEDALFYFVDVLVAVVVERHSFLIYVILIFRFFHFLQILKVMNWFGASKEFLRRG